MVKGARIPELDDDPATSSESNETQKERISLSKRQECRAHIYSQNSRRVRICPGATSILLPKWPVKRPAVQFSHRRQGIFARVQDDPESRGSEDGRKLIRSVSGFIVERQTGAGVAPLARGFQVSIVDSH